MCLFKDEVIGLMAEVLGTVMMDLCVGTLVVRRASVLLGSADGTFQNVELLDISHGGALGVSWRVQNEVGKWDPLEITLAHQDLGQRRATQDLVIDSEGLPHERFAEVVLPASSQLYIFAELVTDLLPGGLPALGLPAFFFTTDPIVEPISRRYLKNTSGEHTCAFG